MTQNAGFGGTSSRFVAAILMAGGVVGCGSNPTTTTLPPDMSAGSVDCVQHPELPQCGGCTVDDDCADTPDTPRCDVTKSLCVPCLPDQDNCATGQVCQQLNGTFVCAEVCNTNADCSKLGGGSLCCGGHCVNPGL